MKKRFKGLFQIDRKRMDGKMKTKKRRLKKGIKKGLVIIAVIVSIIGLLMLDNYICNKAVEKCVNKGHSVAYCRSGL